MLHAFVIGMVAVGACAGIRGVALLVRGLRYAGDAHAPLWGHPGHPRRRRGERVLPRDRHRLRAGWLVAFGAVFLAEELYETGLVALVLRAVQRSPAA